MTEGPPFTNAYIKSLTVEEIEALSLEDRARLTKKQEAIIFEKTRHGTSRNQQAGGGDRRRARLEDQSGAVRGGQAYSKGATRARETGLPTSARKQGKT